MLREEDGGLNALELRSINPRGTVPTLLDGDLILTDSIGILAYLDRKQPRREGSGARCALSRTTWNSTPRRS
jgi:glutathione S-transferase